MFEEDGARSRAHGLPKYLLEKQAHSLNIPLVTRSASWAEYKREFVDQLRRFKEEGVQVGVFGDIALEGHYIWQKNVCASAGLGAYLPLWQRSRREVAHQFVSLGFKAVIVAINRQMIDSRFLGQPYDEETMAELEQEGVDVSGEGGEFHTFVTDGPLFHYPIPVQFDSILSDGEYCFLNWL